MKIAYLINVHHNPRLLARTIAALSTPNAVFLVHVDNKADLTDFQAAAIERVEFIEPRISVFWGEFSQVQATLRLIRQALVRNRDLDYLVFLQGSDYPLRSGYYIQRFFETNSGSEFINLVEMPAPGYSLAKIDILRYPSDQPFRRLLWRALGKIGCGQRDHTTYLQGLKPYAGQAYWALSNGACQYILDFLTHHERIAVYFEHTFTADEVLFHTILGNSPFATRCRKSLMYVQPTWSDTSDNRHRIDERHIEWFEATDRVWTDDEWGAGEMLFARKFSDDRLDLVDRIDNMIARKEEGKVDTRLEGGTTMGVRHGRAIQTSVDVT